MTAAVRTRHSIRFRGRSFMALVLSPEPPVSAWLAEFDSVLERSSGFFVGRPVVVNLSALPQEAADLAVLIDELVSRNVRVIGVEGVDETLIDPKLWGLPPMMSGGRSTGVVDIPEKSETKAAKPAKAQAPAEADGPRNAPSTLTVDAPVRSGQSIYHPEGDVIVIGSVASGAEIVAGGSIHVYGRLRGRAVAGWGNAGARIYCRSMEAELVAIDGLYRTADDMDSRYRGQAVQAWLDGDEMRMAALT